MAMAPSLSASPEGLWHDAFYRLVPVADPALLAQSLRVWAHGLTGCLWVAPEGINGALAGSESALAAFQKQLLTDVCWGASWAGMLFKRSACRTAPFQRLKVMCHDVLLPLEWPAAMPTKAMSPVSESYSTSALSLLPDAWRELMQHDDVVLLDNRNSFEYRLGRFKGAVDPQVQHFRDFPRYVQDRMPVWQAQRKRVAMYCTGGIRCDKTSAWLQAQGLRVYTLEGGVLNYFEQMPDAAREWEGECFVFDNRIALDTRLQETVTEAEQVYNTPQDNWRLARARRLDKQT